MTELAGRNEHETGDHVPGSIVRKFTPTSIDALIVQTQTEIRTAFRSDNIERVLILISRKIGLRMVRALY